MVGHQWSSIQDKRGRRHRGARDEAILEALVVPFSVIVRDVFRHGPGEMPVPNRNQPVQASFCGLLTRDHWADDQRDAQVSALLVAGPFGYK